MKAFYFGCWRTTGHYLHDENGFVQWRQLRVLPWTQIDGGLCPGADNPSRRTHANDQIEGRLALHHRGGWTALAFWDRSIDQRLGSNSVFIAEGTFTADEMLASFRERFPSIVARFSFELVLEEP